MRSISHWGMFESFDKEVRVAYSPDYVACSKDYLDLLERANAHYRAKLTQNAANALFPNSPNIYQTNNFGKLD